MLNTPNKNVEHAQKKLNTPTHNNHKTEEHTQPNARTHLTKHGQNTKTQILAKCGHDLPLRLQRRLNFHHAHLDASCLHDWKGSQSQNPT